MGNSRCKNQARAPESGRWRLNALCSSNGSSLCVGSYIQVPAYPVLSTHIEQFTFAGVKRVMNRFRVMLGSLLPALWLSATGYCLLDSISDYEDDRQDASIFATRPDNRLPIQGSCSFQKSVRCWSRRVGVHSGPDGFSPFLAASDWALPNSLQADVPFALLDGPLGLAKCWQFQWRTALEPRAPSSVS